MVCVLLDYVVRDESVGRKKWIWVIVPSADVLFFGKSVVSLVIAVVGFP